MQSNIVLSVYDAESEKNAPQLNVCDAYYAIP